MGSRSRKKGGGKEETAISGSLDPHPLSHTISHTTIEMQWWDVNFRQPRDGKSMGV